jgi:type IV secretory pathway ATPase VirB11/archaellum biosynthesis ATPase
MTRQILTPTSKKEIKDALTSKLDGRSYNYFQGEIRKGNKYVNVHYYFTGNKVTIQITYWQDGIDYAIETASNCSTPTGVANKVAKFLDLK